MPVFRDNDRKADREKKGIELERDKEALLKKVEAFNRKHGYDYELVRKTQVDKYRGVLESLKITINETYEILHNLHPWLRK